MAGPNIQVRGVRQSIPQGYILARTSPGTGPVELVKLSDLTAATGVGKLPAAAVPPPIPPFTLDSIGSTQGDVLYRGASAWAALPPGTSGQVLTSGGASANPAWVTPPVDIAVYVEQAPTTLERLLRFTASRGYTFPGNLVGSVASASTAATASTAFDVQKNGSSVGTITFALGATTATFVTAGGSAITLVATDYLEIFAPVTPDATLKEIGFTLKGSRT